MVSVESRWAESCIVFISFWLAKILRQATWFFFWSKDWGTWWQYPLFIVFGYSYSIRKQKSSKVSTILLSKLPMHFSIHLNFTRTLPIEHFRSGKFVGPHCRDDSRPSAAAQSTNNPTCYWFKRKKVYLKSL